jgi:hypothetical protein
MLQACMNISFGIPNHKEKVRAGQVKAVVCDTERDLDDWFGYNRFLLACPSAYY